MTDGAIAPPITPAARRRGLGSNLLDLIYPRGCVYCDVPVAGTEAGYVCDPCLDDFMPIMEPCCRMCGIPYPGMVSINATCGNCRLLEPVFRRGRSLFSYRGPAGHIVRSLKYRGARYLAPDFAAAALRVPWLADFLGDSVLVPVPLHPRRLGERGFNQSLLIAEAIGATTGNPVAPMLERKRYTRTQTHLDRQQRLRNVKNAFDLSATRPLSSSVPITIIDDVFTTGSTLNACSAALYAAGYEDLRILAFARD